MYPGDAPDPGHAGNGENRDWRNDKFWREFAYAKQHGTLAEFFAYYTPDLPGYRHLVETAQMLATEAVEQPVAGMET